MARTLNADDYSGDDSVPDMELVEKHQTRYETLKQQAADMYAVGDTDYATQMGLDAMGSLDIVYAELGVWFDDASRDKRDPRGT